MSAETPGEPPRGRRDGVRATTSVSQPTAPAIRGSAAAGRRLIARLRDIMAGAGSAQHRLDRTVQLIAGEMVAEVCSVYVLRAGEVLELFATIGLNPEAVRRTRLIVGEGLIGEIAARAHPLALADAQAHPNFAYRPETGEDPYQSLAGVPLLRGGRVRGVLAIQNLRRRNYSDDEVETLETVAMVLAELVAGGELVATAEVSTADDAGVLQHRLGGIGFTGGLALGQAVLHRPRLTLREIVAEDPVREEARLAAALAAMHRQIDELLGTETLGSGEHRDVLEAYRLFARDRGWMNRLREAVTQGLSAEAAVERVQAETRARMAQVTDSYLRERLQDLEDVSNRLLRHLTGRREVAEGAALPQSMVLIARVLGPAELLDYDQSRLAAVVLEEGTPTSHVAIVARALGIPLVGRCTDALSRIEPGDLLLVDGDTGQVSVRPSEDLIEGFAQAVAARERRLTLHRALRHHPSVTRDGEPVSLSINAGLQIELPLLAEVGADGIGLYRTEIPFMVSHDFPALKAQTSLYAEVLNKAAGLPVHFRTLDIGGDKRLPYFPLGHEENPALGWRAIRIGLERPAMLRTQLRAMIRAAAGRTLSVMFPLVAEVAELDRARALLDRELHQARKLGHAPDTVRVGVMVEVPSLLWQLDALLRGIDFLAIGTNDLMQYLYAADRDNPRVSRRYDPLSAPFLCALSAVVEKARAARIPCCVCGEMAGNPLEAMALIGLGVRSLSMPAQAVGSVKTMVRSVDAGAVAAFLGPHLRGRDHSLRDRLRAFALDHDIVIEGVAGGRAGG